MTARRAGERVRFAFDRKKVGPRTSLRRVDRNVGISQIDQTPCSPKPRTTVRRVESRRILDTPCFAGRRPGDSPGDGLCNLLDDPLRIPEPLLAQSRDVPRCPYAHRGPCLEPVGRLADAVCLFLDCNWLDSAKGVPGISRIGSLPAGCDQRPASGARPAFRWAGPGRDTRTARSRERRPTTTIR